MKAMGGVPGSGFRQKAAHHSFVGPAPQPGRRYGFAYIDEASEDLCEGEGKSIDRSNLDGGFELVTTRWDVFLHVVVDADFSAWLDQYGRSPAFGRAGEASQLECS